MARLSDIESGMRQFLTHFKCPDINTNAWCNGPPRNQRRVALISSAGLRRRDDRPFSVDATDYRVLPLDKRDEVIQDHTNASHGRTGYLEDVNTIFPLERLMDLEAAGEIGSVAHYHYSFMGATRAETLKPEVRKLAGVLKADKVDAVILCPV